MTTSVFDATGTNPHDDERALIELFPEGTHLDAEGELVVGGVRLTDIAERFGTPAYVLDESALIRQATLFREALAARWPNSRVVFASKAFPATAVYRTLAEAGLGADVAGGGELALALAAGVRPDTIVVHGNAKSADELRAAVDAGVGLVVIDNFDDIAKLEDIVTGRQDVLVRVLPDVAAETHEALATGKQGSKFGLGRADAEEAIARLRASDRLNLRGLHMHIGSQICEVDPYVAAVRALASYGEFDIYDLGGGLGVRYTYDDAPPSVEAWLDGLVGAAAAHLPRHAQLLIEPGRSVVARSGLTLYRVVSVKKGHPTFVAVDGGMGDNLEVSLYGQRFEATVVNRVGGGEVVNLVGKHCESGDRLSTGVPLREPRVGDVVAVPVTGAYCHTMANNYNGARRPPVIFADGQRTRAVVRRETYEDLTRRDLADVRGEV
ncbi:MULTISPECIES: diaminopimelate decarboxylase [unclassified Streptomyces]|uniref:diaminopimelate decarboxylase n=1 Tax=unclassified Streptomyces TaxID=2593676 RepID=UPI003812B4C8